MPDWRTDLRSRLAPLRLAPAREAEIIEELSAHLDDRYRELVAGGRSALEARQLAVEDLASPNALADRLRAVVPTSSQPVPLGAERGRFMGGVWQDVRYGLRTLRKNPGFAAAAIIMLALGTGANAAMFSVVDAVMLRSPFRDPARIAVLRDRHDPKRTSSLNAPPDEVRQLRETTEVFDSVSPFGLASPILTGLGDPRRLRVECVGAGMFHVLGITPALGRGFSEDEDQPGAEPVVIVSTAFWRQTLGGNAAAVGRTINLDGNPVTVIGVLPADFDGVRSLGRTDAWAPLGAGAAGRPSPSGCQVRGGSNVYARVRSDLTIHAADTRLQALTNSMRGLTSLEDSTVGDDRTMLLMLLGAVSFVLLIACANVANLLLERAIGRRREIATRLALGASAGRIVRQVLTESVLLATLGTLAGLGAARAVLGVLVSLMPGGIPHVGHIALNGSVLAVALATGVAAGLVAGIVPAWQSSARGLMLWLQDARAVTLPSRSWTRRALVIGEVALSVALLIGAALMVRSFLALLPTHPGFDPTNKLVATIQLSGDRYRSSPVARLAFDNEWTGRLSALPGVRGVSTTAFVPFGDFVAFVPIVVTGRPDMADGHVGVFASTVTANYLDEMRIPVKRGRGVVPADDARGMPVAVVNETMARRFWPDGDPLGAELTIKSPGFTDVTRRIVGVVGDTRTFVSGSLKAQLYVPLVQDPSVYLSVVVRTSGTTPAGLASAIRREAAAVDATQVVETVTPFEENMSRSMAPWRFVTWLMTTFAVMAIGLAVVGLAAVVGSSVAQRTREIGIRMTLGARPGTVVGLILGQGLALALCGTLLGIGLAAGTTRFLADSLYGVTPLDLGVFAAAAALMLLVAAVASYVPARRAARLDPLAAIRND